MSMSFYASRAAQCFARNPGWVLAVALVISLLAGWATVQLPVYTSRQALLPQNTEVAQRFNRFLENFGAGSDLIVVLEGAPRHELEAFADDLAKQLEAEPEIDQATARLDPAFFLQHAYLLMPMAELDKLAHLKNAALFSPTGLEATLQQALQWSQQPTAFGADGTDLANAESHLKLAGFFFAEWQRWLTLETPPKNLDWQRLLAKNGTAVAGGHFASRDGRMLFLFVHPSRPTDNFENLGPFVTKVRQVSADLSAQAQAAGRMAPTVGLTGLPAIEYEEYTNIRQDIFLVLLTSASLVAALILLVVRSLRWAGLIFIPMGLGVLWSLGLALITVGHLTLITAAFIAILFGLGADYGIFTSSRIAEERRAGKPLVMAIGDGIGSSFGAVLTAGGASLLIFSALATVDFPGFAELGVVAAKGVLMILLNTWIVQPALYALMPPTLPAPRAPAATKQQTWPERFPLPVAVSLLLLALGSAGFGAVKGLAIPFDHDVLAMLPKDSQAAYYQRRMVAESDFQAEAIVFIARDLADARRISQEAAKQPSIAQVQSLAGLFPEDADARFRKALDISASLSNAQYAGHIAELKQTGVSAKSYALLQAVLANAIPAIDNAQEQAFSAGHARWVASLEEIRRQMTAISAQLAEDSEHGLLRSADFFRALLAGGEVGLDIITTWQQTQPLTPERLPPVLRKRFFADDGSIAIYAFPKNTVYDPDNLEQLIQETYRISPEATGFPTTHHAFAKAAVASFTRGTQLALVLCLLWVMLATRSIRGFTLAVLPLLIGGGWMLGLMAWGGIRYNYANIVALPLVIALAVDYGVWFNYRWQELKNHSPREVTLTAGKVIVLAAGTELAGLGAIALARYQGVASLGISISIGLLCCLAATLLVAPAIGQLIYPERNP